MDTDANECGTSTCPRNRPPIGTGNVSRTSVDSRNRSPRTVSRMAAMSSTTPTIGNSNASHPNGLPPRIASRTNSSASGTVITFHTSANPQTKGVRAGD